MSEGVKVDGNAISAAVTFLRPIFQSHPGGTSNSNQKLLIAVLLNQLFRRQHPVPKEEWILLMPDVLEILRQFNFSESAISEVVGELIGISVIKKVKTKRENVLVDCLMIDQSKLKLPGPQIPDWLYLSLKG